jgi:aryl-alcohol dehydrogenase-like predicted oxidoreductase
MRFERQGRPSTLVFPNALPRHCAKPTRVSYIFSLINSPLTLSIVAKIDAVQAEYSAFETLHETDGLIQTAKELGIAFVAFSPLGHGWLVDDFPYKTPDDFAPNDFRRTGESSSH